MANTHGKTLNVTNRQRNASKATMGYHLTLVRMAIINKSTSTRRGGCGGKGTPRALLVGMQAGTATVENSMEAPQINKNGAAIPTVQQFYLWYLCGEIKTLTQKAICAPMFIAALPVTATTWEPRRCALGDTQVKEKWYTGVQWNTAQP